MTYNQRKEFTEAEAKDIENLIGKGTKKAAKETAKKMKKEKISIEIIERITRLSKEEIEKL